MGITLVNLGDALASLGNYELSETYFQEAEGIYQNLADRAGLAEVTRGRGRIAILVGDYSRAFDLMSAACLTAHELWVKPLTVLTIEGLAFIAQKQGDPEKAAILLGASDSLRQKYKLPRIFIHQADCDGYLADIRSCLDEPAFEAAWAEGTRMPIDRIVAYATQSAG